MQHNTLLVMTVIWIQKRFLMSWWSIKCICFAYYARYIAALMRLLEIVPQWLYLIIVNC